MIRGSRRRTRGGQFEFSIAANRSQLVMDYFFTSGHSLSDKGKYASFAGIVFKIL
jgi:hypothetical protein